MNLPIKKVVLFILMVATSFGPLTAASVPPTTNLSSQSQKLSVMGRIKAAKKKVQKWVRNHADIISTIGVCSMLALIIYRLNSRPTLPPPDQPPRNPTRGNLEAATLMDDVGAVRRIVERNPGLINARDVYGNTPLHDAAYFGNAQIVEVLLNRGADTQVRNNRGLTPIAVARRFNHQAVIDVLALHEPPIIIPQPGPIVHLPAPRPVEPVVNPPAPDNAAVDNDRLNLSNAVRGADIPEMGRILDRNPDLVNYLDEVNYLECYPRFLAPLHEAVRAGNVPVIEFLLNHGAAPDIEDGANNTALDLAQRAHNRHGIMAVLRQPRRPARAPRPAPEPADPRAPEVNRGDCTVCLDQKVLVPLSCGHAYCGECLNDMLDAAIGGRRDNQVIRASTEFFRCPHLDCHGRSLANDRDIAIITRDHNKIARINRVRLGENPNSKHCPTPNCEHIFLNENHAAQPMRCPACRQEYCSGCLERHPVGARCRTDEEKTAALVEQGLLKPCPSCKTLIDKDGGCFHMNCAKCNHVFCWHCLQSRTCDHFVCNTHRVRLREDGQIEPVPTGGNQPLRFW